MKLTTLTLTLIALWLSVGPWPAAACKNSPAQEAGSGDDCNSPPTNAWSTGSGGTFDIFHLSEWTNSTQKIGQYWNAIEGETCDWDEGWGFYSVGDLNRRLTRLLNATHLVKVVHDHATVPGWGLWRNVKGLSSTWEKGNWFSYLHVWGEDEWEPSCQETDSDGNNPAAGHKVDTDEYNLMHNPGSYRRTTLERAGLMVHEVTHQEVDHLDDDVCPAGSSCDTVFGSFNASTQQINFLHDAYLTYLTEIVNGKLEHQVIYVDGNCRNVPRFAEGERNAALNRARSTLDTRFDYISPDQTPTQVHSAILTKHFQSAWDCDQCDPGQFDFNPGSCSQPPGACNEVINPANQDVNQINAGKCTSYNNVVKSGLSPQELQEAWNTFTPFIGCQPASSKATQAFCDQRKDQVFHVDDLDPCGWISGTTVGLNCAQDFCQEKYQASGPWSPGQDPFGCFQYFCSDGCGSRQEVAQCSADFAMAHGDPDYYYGPCTTSGCRFQFVNCVREAFEAGEWSYPDPPPISCQTTKKICEATSQLAGQILIEQVENPLFLDPGPLHLQAGFQEKLHLARDLSQRVTSIREAAARGDTASARAEILPILSSPELLTQLFHSTPAAFVWLFGADRIDILGPALATVAPKPLTASDLTPAGRIALGELQALMAERGGAPIDSAAGSLRLDRAPQP